MRRRSVLAGIVAGGTLAAGCLAGAARDGPPADATAAVTVGDVDPLAPAHPIEASVAVARSHATPDRTAGVEIAFANPSNRIYELRAGDGDWPVLSDRASDPLEPGLALVGEDDEFETPAPAERPSPDCWKLEDDTGNPFQDVRLTRLDPGGSVSVVFEVWGHHRNGDGTCLPEGRFRFEDTYRIENAPDGGAFDWGFTVRVDGDPG